MEENFNDADAGRIRILGVSRRDKEEKEAGCVPEKSKVEDKR